MTAGTERKHAAAGRATKSSNKYVRRRTEAERRLLIKQAEALHAQQERDDAHALVQVLSTCKHCTLYYN
jgi:hypothetical protein